MRVAVVGATGVIGASAVQAMVATGHDVVALARTPEGAAAIRERGATAFPGDIFDQHRLTAMFEGCDVVVNAATRIPVGLRATRSSAWRENDRLRTEGVRQVTAAARAAHVRRLVQESVSLVYADHGDEWIDEQNSLGINSATEPVAVGESLVQEYQSDLRQGVVLRLGMIIGDDATTRWLLRGRAVAGPSASARRTGGCTRSTPTTSVRRWSPRSPLERRLQRGADPVRRRDLVQGYAEAVGRDSVGFMGPVLRRLSGRRAEPLTRSLRVSSEHFRSQTGWAPRRAHFGASWLQVRVWRRG